MSPDEEFSQTGAKSGISYVASFKAYKDIITTQSATPRFKKILLLFNERVFGKNSDFPKKTVPIDQGNYDDKIQEYLREDSPPPPAEPTLAVAEDIENPPPSVDLDEAPPSPPPGHRASTSITVQESDTIKTSSTSMTISITTLPSEPQAEEDNGIFVVRPKKSRPAPRKKVNTTASDAADITLASTTRAKTAGSFQVSPPVEQDPQPTTRTSGRKRGTVNKN